MADPIVYRPQTRQVVEVFVAGRPAPQGSKRYLGNSKGGKGITIESSKAVAPWRTDVRDTIKPQRDGLPPELGAIAVVLEFVMPRPASTPKRRRTPLAIKRPDLDKLERAVLDAIGSAGVWKDDSQVVQLVSQKRLAELHERPGCRITVYSGLEDS